VDDDEVDLRIAGRGPKLGDLSDAPHQTSRPAKAAVAGRMKMAWDQTLSLWCLLPSAGRSMPRRSMR
jgi:hypothetical protein